MTFEVAPEASGQDVGGVGEAGIVEGRLTFPEVGDQQIADHPVLHFPPVDQFLAKLDSAAAEDLAFISFTYPFNMTGQPAISIPAGFSRDGWS